MGNHRQILSLVRLPIPPLRQSGSTGRNTTLSNGLQPNTTALVCKHRVKSQAKRSADLRADPLHELRCLPPASLHALSQLHQGLVKGINSNKPEAGELKVDNDVN
jgi:hypothetical protein